MRIRVLCAFVVLAAAISAQAQTRTTPVSIDQNNNAVKATQNGTWSVGVTGTPSVNVVNSPAVTVTNSPAVTISGTPTVNVANTPAVKLDKMGNTVSIDPVNNAVSTLSNTLSVRPWSTDQTIDNGRWAYSQVIGCHGYGHLRIMFAANSSSKSLQVHYLVMVPVVSGAGFERAVDIGYGTFGNTSGLTTDASFTQTTDVCSLDLPVMGDYCQIGIYNGTGSQVTIYHWSMVYLVH